VISYPDLPRNVPFNNKKKSQIKGKLAVLSKLVWMITLQPAASALTGSLLEMQVLGPVPELANQEHRRYSPEICVLTSPPGDFDMYLSVKNTAQNKPF
jgi:hypothetical protein